MALLGPSTDYTDKDFDSLNARLKVVIASAFPDWTDTDVADFGNLLRELFAFVGDVLTKYQDNQAAEAFWGRVTQRRNILALCKQIGFVPRGATASLVDLSFTLATAPAGDVVIPERTRGRTEDADPVVFETLAAAQIDAGTTGPVIVTAENAERRQEAFASTGKPNQEVRLAGTPYLDGSAQVVAANGAYEVVDDLLDSTASDRHCTVAVDQDDRARIRFGNGAIGIIPAGTINVTYKVGGGTGGRVDPNAIKRLESTFTDSLGNGVQLQVANPAASSQALDRQSVSEIQLAGPRSLRVAGRTVSREDYEINAERVAGVARSLMLTADQDDGILENQGILFVVPDGGGAPTQAIKDAVLEMVTVTYPNTLTFRVDVQGAPYLTVDVSCRVFFRAGHVKSAVKASIVDRLQRAFAVEPAEGDEDLAVG